MAKEFLDEREFELVNILGGDLGVNQRELSRQMDLSLGLINMLIRRLVAKGYIRITQLNKRKVKYLLTSKGFAEKMRKSVKYTLKTIHSIGLIKESLKQVVVPLYEKGERHFVVVGKSDFAHLIEIVFKDKRLTDCKITYVDDIPADHSEGTLLICKENIDLNSIKTDKKIDLVHELARDYSFVNNHGDE